MKSIVLALAAAAACLSGGPASASATGGGPIVCIGSTQPYATSNVTASARGGYQYFIYIGGDPCATTARHVTDFYIPYFSDMGIDFSGPDFLGTYASYDVEPDSIFELGGEVLHYRFSPPPGSAGAQYVAFDASFGGAEAPFESGLVDSNGNRTTFMGDPLIPGSPELLKALDAANRVSEPGALAIFLSGLGLLLGMRGRGGKRPPALARTAAA